jgi:hypothetical protein
MRRIRSGAEAPGGEATGQTARRRFMFGVIPALLWGAVIYVSVPLSMAILKATLHGQESPSFGDPCFAGPCLNFFIIPAALLLGAWLTLVSACRTATHNSADPLPAK